MSGDQLRLRECLSRRDILSAAGVAGAVILLGGMPAQAKPRFEVTRSGAEWRKRLGPKRYAVLREGATERAGSSPAAREKRNGLFVCAGCGLPLFSSAAKFDSGTGWPSYRSAVFPQNAEQRAIAERTIAHLRSRGKPVATRVESGRFYPAEAHHQDFVRKHPRHRYVVVNDLPKLAKLRRGYPQWWRE